MRLATTLALGLCIALSAPIVANATDGVSLIDARGHHARGHHMQQTVYRSFNPAATAFVPTARSDVDKSDGLSRHRDDCNYGCIDN
jgi:hypothetical protein